MEICGIFSQLLWFCVGTSLWEDPWPRYSPAPHVLKLCFPHIILGLRKNEFLPHIPKCVCPLPKQEPGE